MASASARFDFKVKVADKPIFTYTTISAPETVFEMTTLSQSVIFAAVDGAITLREHKQCGTETAIIGLHFDGGNFDLSYFDPCKDNLEDFKIVLKMAPDMKGTLKDNTVSKKISLNIRRQMPFNSLPLDDFKEIRIIIPKYASLPHFKSKLPTIRSLLEKKAHHCQQHRPQRTAGVRDIRLRDKIGQKVAPKNTPPVAPAFASVPSGKDAPQVNAWNQVSQTCGPVSTPPLSNPRLFALPYAAPKVGAQGSQISVPAPVPKAPLETFALQSPLKSSTGAQGAEISVPAQAPSQKPDPLLERNLIKDWSAGDDSPPSPPPTTKSLGGSIFAQPGFVSDLARPPPPRAPAAPVAPAAPAPPPSAAVAPSPPPPSTPKVAEAVPAVLPQASPVALRQLSEEDAEELADAEDLLVEMKSELAIINDNLAELDSKAVEWQPPADIMDVSRAWKKLKSLSKKAAQSTPTVLELGVQKMKMETLIIPQLEAKIAALKME
jgi:hypothetical protein